MSFHSPSDKSAVELLPSRPDHWELSGFLHQFEFGNTLTWQKCLIASSSPQITLDFVELEIEDSVSNLAIVDFLRAVLRGGKKIRIESAPQILAHTLYRAGLLRSGDILLINPRQEEPYG